MCHHFYHCRGSCPLKRSEVISRVPNQRQDLHTLTARSPVDGTADTFCSQACGPHEALTTPPQRARQAKGRINKRAEGDEEPEAKQRKMELFGVNWVLAAAGFLLWSAGGSAAPMECHFNSRALCEFEGRHFSLGETWMDNACMQCTCLHPVGVGCCETVHRPVDFPAWCQVRVEPVTCKVSLVQAADPRLPCSPGNDLQDPSHGALQLQQQLEG